MNENRNDNQKDSLEQLDNVSLKELTLKSDKIIPTLTPSGHPKNTTTSNNHNQNANIVDGNSTPTTFHLNPSHHQNNNELVSPPIDFTNHTYTNYHQQHKSNNFFNKNDNVNGQQNQLILRGSDLQTKKAIFSNRVSQEKLNNNKHRPLLHHELQENSKEFEVEHMNSERELFSRKLHYENNLDKQSDFVNLNSVPVVNVVDVQNDYQKPGNQQDDGNYEIVKQESDAVSQTAQLQQIAENESQKLESKRRDEEDPLKKQLASVPGSPVKKDKDKGNGDLQPQMGDTTTECRGGKLTAMPHFPNLNPTNFDKSANHDDINNSQVNNKSVTTLQELEAQFNGVFNVHSKTLLFDKRSLFCFSADNRLRQGLVWLVEWRWFENFITVCICLNSIALATKDYSFRVNPGGEFVWNGHLEVIDAIFSGLFIFECVCKILAQGFIVHKKSYLRDAWNWLDFFIVCVSVITMTPASDNESLKALRTLRILRPLRSISTMQSMRALIQTMLKSIPGLFNVIIFLVFIFTIFAIFGVNTFVGAQYSFCRTTDSPTIILEGDSVAVSWPISEEASWLCSDDNSCRNYPNFIPESGDTQIAKCGNLYRDYQISPELVDQPKDLEIIEWDIVNFNNIGKSLVLIFQVLTLEGWTQMMHRYMDAGHTMSAVIFFPLVVIFGAFFAMNLVLAQIMHSFIEQHTEQKRIMDQKKKQEQIKAEQARQSIIEKKKLKKAQSLQHNVSGGQTPTLEKQNLEEANQIQAVTIPQDGQGPKIVSKSRYQLRSIQSQDENGKIRKESEDPFEIEEEKLKIHREPTAAFQRAQKNKCNNFFYKIVVSVLFNFVVFCLIIANTVILALYRFDNSKERTELFSILNEFFTWIFFVEMLLKLLGLGVKQYVRDKFNLFDGFIVIISLVEWTLLQSFSSDTIGPLFRILRALRLLRVIKLARSWTTLQDIISKMFASLKDISSFTFLLVLFMFIFALLGMEMFAHIAYFDLEENLLFGESLQKALLDQDEQTQLVVPRENFNSIGFALTTVFIVIVGEDWNQVMQLYTRAFGGQDETKRQFAVAYFVTCIILGNIICLALFTAILLHTFEKDYKKKLREKVDEEVSLRMTGDFRNRTAREKVHTCWTKFIDIFKQAENEADLDESQQDSKKIRRVSSSNAIIPYQDKNGESLKVQQRLEEMGGSSSLPNQHEKLSDEKEENSSNMYQPTSLLHFNMSQVSKQMELNKTRVEEIDYLEGCSLNCFSQENPFRVICHAITSHKRFDNLILVLIVVSTVALAFENPLSDPNSMMLKILKQLDFYFTLIFIVECLLKIFTRGLLFNGSQSYLKNFWNVMDFIIVISAVLDILAGDAANLSFLKSIRILRIMRPLRLIARNKSLQVAISSLVTSLPRIGNLQIVLLFFIFMLAILQTTLFSGTFHRCSTEHMDSLSEKQRQILIQTQLDCVNYGGEWVRPDLNFDSILASMMTLLVMSSTEGWIGVMWDSVDARKPYQSPLEGANNLTIVLFVVIIIALCLLFLNLFVGVVIETFNREKDNTTLARLLKIEQRTWIRMQISLYKAKPVPFVDINEAFRDSPMRFYSTKLIRHAFFDGFILTCIILNTIVLGINWFMMPDGVNSVLEVVNYIFMAIFTIEAFVKIVALRKDYFKDSWNLFDFTVVILTAIILCLTLASLDIGVGSSATILRTLRIGRVLRLIKKAQKLQIIFQTLLDSMPSLASLGFILCIFFFMFSIIGMQLFATVKIGEGQDVMDEHTNFRNFGNSFLTLLRCATGESWHQIMFDSARTYDLRFQCNRVENFESIQENGGQIFGCGSPYPAYIFHIMFQIMVTQIFLNLFIAVIIDSFLGQSDLFKVPVQQDAVTGFTDIWSKYDREATGFVTIDDLYRLLNEICQTKQTKSLVINAILLRKSETERRDYLKNLQIPTYDTFKRVMFYDTLLQMATAVNRYKFNKDQIEEDYKKQKILSKFALLSNQGAKKTGESLTKKSFNSMIFQLDRAESKIELLQILRNQLIEVHLKYYYLVDTRENLLQSREERQAYADVEIKRRENYFSPRKSKILSSIDLGSILSPYKGDRSSLGAGGGMIGISGVQGSGEVVPLEVEQTPKGFPDHHPNNNNLASSDSGQGQQPTVDQNVRSRQDAQQRGDEGQNHSGQFTLPPLFESQNKPKGLKVQISDNEKVSDCGTPPSKSVSSEESIDDSSSSQSGKNNEKRIPKLFEPKKWKTHLAVYTTKHVILGEFLVRMRKETLAARQAKTVAKD